MTKTIPNYLRIHRGPAQRVRTAPVASPDSIDGFWDAYREATGWRIDSRQLDRGDAEILPAATSDLMAGESLEESPVVGRSDALRLAQSAAQLARELEEARSALRRQEAELASRAAVVADDTARDRLADRLEKLLADATAACVCDAAAVYILDDDTTRLSTRSVFGLNPQRLESSPRPLRGSRGDLEALVRGVVAIDELSESDGLGWHSPEPFPSGICAALVQDGLPIGTLWLFANRRTEFNSAQTAAARVAAAGIASELARAASVPELPSVSRTALRDVSEYQYQSLPTGSRIASDWFVDGMLETPASWACGWHCWDVLPDGSLMMAIADAADRSMAGALTATSARAALTAHVGYRHTPAQLMQRVNDTLWQSSTAQQLISLLYLRIDPESGEGEVAAAGNIVAMIGGRYGFRPLVDGSAPLLTEHIDAHCYAETFRIGEEETLLAYTQGVLADGAGQRALGESLRDSMREQAANPLAMVRRRLAELPLQHERGLAAITRRRE